MSNPYDKIYKTRFAELGFTKIEPGCWSFVDVTVPDSPSKVGTHYPSREQLVANIERYAAEYGCDGADKTLRENHAQPKAARMEVTSSTLCMMVERYKDTIFMPLPPELWRRIDSGPAGIGCGCDICKADSTGGYWDTLAVGKDAPKNANDFTYTVHHPALHYEGVRKAHAYVPEAK